MRAGSGAAGRTGRVGSAGLDRGAEGELDQSGESKADELGKAEIPIIIRSSIPVFLTQLAEWSLVLASVISIGHLGTTELAASSWVLPHLYLALLIREVLRP